MSPEGKAKVKQQQISLLVPAYPALKKSLDQLGKNILIPGSFWEGRMSKEEHITEYQCTIVDFSLAHRSQAGEPPTQAFQLKEMGVSGTGSLCLKKATQVATSFG